MMTLLRDLFIAKREHWILWMPVALGAGIALYFGLPEEPPKLAGLTVLGAAFLLISVFRNNWPLRLALLALIALSLGFVVAQWRTHDVASI